MLRSGNVFGLTGTSFCDGEADTIICEGKSAKLFCATGVIKISSAVYGRTRGSEVCPSREITVTNCRSPTSTAKAKILCNGKESCTLIASNSVFGDPCRNNYKYLQVKHTCGQLK
ncbi:L-rhamnose-binding lectin CSL3-like [Dreissena polymorpha]|uniref:L-rhamnose-binding lectin CSL3-like n=1 Tax=Dreissena polymorpha TaxID=45954 RepID=UPI002264562A|nr:L-rhamnose-binding lectin CSL3-like [Dreissena polymorpha]